MSGKVIVLFFAICGLVNGDISGTNPPAGSCLCVDFDSVNVRQTACGTVIGYTGFGDCYPYTGTKVVCDLSGTPAESFEVEYNAAGNAWIVGTFLVLGNDVDCDCAVTRYNSTSGLVMSPNYPNPYPPNFHCIFSIFLPLGQLAFITFNEPFWIEMGFDSLTIRVTSIDFCPRNEIDTFDGTNLPNPVAYQSCTATDTIVLEFTTDFSREFAGFSLNYNFGVCSFPPFTTPSGLIQSPNYPNNYPAYSNCTNTIELAQPSNITLSFNSVFFIEQVNDWVKIKISQATCGRDQEYTFYGNVAPADIVLPGCSFVSVVFQSGGSVQRQGFSLSYTSV